MVYRHRLVRSLLVHFAEAASMDRPMRVFTRPGVFEQHMLHRGGLTDGERLHLRKGYAMTVRRTTRPNDVYFNLPFHQSLDDLTDSAIHEVVHQRWVGLRGCTKSDSLFARRVTALKNGYRCGPKGSPLPAAFR